jgi:hypothetical protein
VRFLKGKKTDYPEIPRRSMTEENVAEVKAMIKEVTKQMGAQNLELAGIADHLTTANLQTELALIDPSRLYDRSSY